MTFIVEVDPRVRKAMKKLQLKKAHRAKILEFIEVLKENPVPRDRYDALPINWPEKDNCKWYRFRVGDYRLIYCVNWKEKKVIVLDLKPREKAYKH